MGEGLPTEAEGASGKVSSESSPGPSTLGAGGAGPVPLPVVIPSAIKLSRA